VSECESVRPEREREQTQTNERENELRIPQLLPILLHLNRDWSPRFSTLRDKNGWVRDKTA
jgi:hypothetical protein